KSAQIREILISESAWEEMTCLFAPSLIHSSGMNVFGLLVISENWPFQNVELISQEIISTSFCLTNMA
ncbi:hypothetical protein, partial [Escherichia coli]